MANGESDGQGDNSAPISSLLLLLAALLWPTILAAADAVIDTGPHGVQSFTGVTLHSASTGSGGDLIFQLALGPNASPYPVERQRVQSLRFVPPDDQKLFRVTIDDGTGLKDHEGVRIVGYERGNFALIPAGGTQAALVKGSVVRAIAPELAALTTRAPPAAATAAGLPPTPSPTPAEPATLDELAAQIEASGAVSDGESGLATPDGEDEYMEVEFLPDTITGSLGGDLALAGGAIGALILVAGVGLTYLFTTIWLMVYAFKDGEIVAALLILCCTFGKIWYVFSKYEGPAPGVFKILVTLEFLSIVLFRFADVMLLAR